MKKKDFDEVGIELMLDESPHAFDRSRSVPARLGTFAAALAAVCLGVSSLVAPAAYAAATVTESAVSYWDSLPTDLPLDQALPQHTVLLDKDGKEFARFFSENRIDVPLEKISENFTGALIAAEDARFNEHGGIDAVGLARAMVSNVKGGNGRQGASTLTQQLVQNIMINNARDETEQSVAVGTSGDAKLREMKYAVALEERYTKDEILNAYANAVYFGNAAYGVQAAAKIYFNTTADKLTVPQAALLVGMLKGPSVYDPVTHPEAAKNRRDTVIARMLTTETITPAEAEAAMAEPVTLTRGSIPSGCESSDYPYYCSLVRTEILTDEAFGKTEEERQNALTRGGMTITTALDRKAMDASQNAVTEALGNGNRGALGTATIIPGTGHISAVAQNREWGQGEGQTEIVYADSAFQVGSSMKPLVMATALEQGIPASERLSASAWYSPANLDEPEGGFQNYGAADYGILDGRGALKVSSNTYFIRLIERTGVLPVADMSARLGITSLPRSGPSAIMGREASLALGAYPVSPLEMANAYAVFAAKGIACKPVTVTAGVRSDTGRKITVTDPECHQAIAEPVANTVADALKQPLTKGGTLEELGGVKGHESGVKTGTTNNFAANWTVGITAGYSTAVWLGDPRGDSRYPLDSLDAYGRTYTNLTGSEVAAPVWKKIMDAVNAGKPKKALPRADDAATSVPSAKTVPDVRGLNADEAVSILLRAGLRPAVSPDTAALNTLHAPGVVVEQTPAPGSALGFRQEASVTLSHGSDTALSLPEGK